MTRLAPGEHPTLPRPIFELRQAADDVTNRAGRITRAGHPAYARIVVGHHGVLQTANPARLERLAAQLQELAAALRSEQRTETNRPARSVRRRRMTDASPPTSPEPPMASTTASDVYGEVVALHWGSHGKGATVAEVASALELSGLELGVGDVAVVLAELEEAGAIERLNQRRDGWVVNVPTAAGHR